MVLYLVHPPERHLPHSIHEVLISSPVSSSLKAMVSFLLLVLLVPRKGSLVSRCVVGVREIYSASSSGSNLVWYRMLGPCQVLIVGKHFVGLAVPLQKSLAISSGAWGCWLPDWGNRQLSQTNTNFIKYENSWSLLEVLHQHRNLGCKLNIKDFK